MSFGSHSVLVWPFVYASGRLGQVRGVTCCMCVTSPLFLSYQILVFSLSKYQITKFHSSQYFPKTSIKAMLECKRRQNSESAFMKLENACQDNGFKYQHR